MRTVIKAALLCLLPVIGNAHSQSPGFEVEHAQGSTHSKNYLVSNEYSFPITLKIEVFEKDGSEATGWFVEKDTYKMLPGSKKIVSIRFDAGTTRKLIVCSTLKGIGYEEKTPPVVSRVCSRLIINGYGG